MRPKVKGKIAVALIISLIAFGFGTAAELIVGINSNSTLPNFNLTQQGKFPSLPYSTSSNVTTTQNNAQYTPPTEHVYVEPTKNSSSSGSSSGSSGSGGSGGSSSNSSSNSSKQLKY